MTIEVIYMSLTLRPTEKQEVDADKELERTLKGKTQRQWYVGVRMLLVGTVARGACSLFPCLLWSRIKLGTFAGAHHQEPPSPTQTLWDNLCAYLFIFRTVFTPGELKFPRKYIVFSDVRISTCMPLEMGLKLAEGTYCRLCWLTAAVSQVTCNNGCMNRCESAYPKLVSLKPWSQQNPSPSLKIQASSEIMWFEMLTLHVSLSEVSKWPAPGMFSSLRTIISQ